MRVICSEMYSSLSVRDVRKTVCTRNYYNNRSNINHSVAQTVADYLYRCRCITGYACVLMLRVGYIGTINFPLPYLPKNIGRNINPNRTRFCTDISDLNTIC
jgi:hypothetical protein